MTFETSVIVISPEAVVTLGVVGIGDSFFFPLDLVLRSLPPLTCDGTRTGVAVAVVLVVVGVDDDEKTKGFAETTAVLTAVLKADDTAIVKGVVAKTPSRGAAAEDAATTLVDGEKKFVAEDKAATRDDGKVPPGETGEEEASTEETTADSTETDPVVLIVEFRLLILV